MIIQFSVKNLDLIQRAFEWFPKKDANKIIRQSIRTAIKPLFLAIVAYTRAAAIGGTGKLAASTKVRVLKYKKYRRKIAIGVIQGMKYPGQYPGGFLEYGTKHIRARHYVQRATDAKRTEVQNILNRDMTRDLVNAINARMR